MWHEFENANFGEKNMQKIAGKQWGINNSVWSWLAIEEEKKPFLEVPEIYLANPNWFSIAFLVRFFKNIDII